MITVFVDRDGVINRNREDYVKTLDELEIIPSALEGLAKLKAAGIDVFVVSNQAGVGRGLTAPEELDRINGKVRDTVEAAGGEIKAFYCCTHGRNDGCSCRKPEIGLFLQAGRDWGFDLDGCWFIGDARTDFEAGHKAGLKTILVLTGKSTAADVDGWIAKPDFIVEDLPAAAEVVLAGSK